MLADTLKYFAKLIETELGIVYEGHNLFQLETRLDQISKTYSLTSLEQLADKIRFTPEPALKQLLFDAATNNETTFFRDQRIFTALEMNVLPTLAEKAKAENRAIAIWSAACSTGQEPYSLAMMLAEMRAKLPFPPARITATDISDRALKQAKAGIYNHVEVQRGLAPEYLAKYFTKEKEGEKWAVSPALRANMDFSSLNLTGPFPMSLGPIDLILCRNVLIYHRVEGKAKILKSMRAKMRPGAFLVLGAGESLIGITDEFEQITYGGVFFYRVKDKA